MRKLLFILLLLVLPAAAQNAFFYGRAFGINPFSPGGAAAAPTPVFLGYSEVRVCTVPASGTQCTPLASIFDVNGNALSVPPGHFGQLITDNTGNFNFQCGSGNLEVQVAATGSNTPQQQYNITCPVPGGGGGGGVSGNGTTGNVAVFTGLTSIGNGVATDDGVRLNLPTSIKLNGTIVNGAAGGTMTLQNAVDTLVGRNTVDTFTNKTFDTAAPNTLKIAGTLISGVIGAGSVTLSTAVTGTGTVSVRATSPGLQGAPTAPTAGCGTGTQIATLSYVANCAPNNAAPQITFTTASAATRGNLGAQTVATAGGSGNTYRVSFYLELTAVGTNCGADTETLAVQLNWNDPLEAGSTGTIYFTAKVTGNGTVGRIVSNNGSGGDPIISFTGMVRAKAASTVTYQVTEADPGASCVLLPQYQVFPIVEQLL